MKYLLAIMAFFALFFIAPQNTYAQTCSQSTINWTYWTCVYDSDLEKSFCSGDPRQSNTNCSYNGSTCEGEIWLTEYCQDWNSTPDPYSGCRITHGFRPYTCGLAGSNPPPPLPTATAGPTATPIPGWGGCGSCGNCDNNPAGSGSHPSGECVRDPYGACVWDIGCRYVPPPADPSCNISLTGPASVPFGGQGSLWVSVNSAVGTINRVLFDVNPLPTETGGYGTVSPVNDTTAAYSTNFTSDRSGYGDTRVRARMYMNGESTPRCSARYIFSVQQPPPSCVIRVIGPATIPFGGTGGYTVVIDQQNYGFIQRVNWNVSAGATLGSVSPTTDTTSPFSTVFTHNRSGTGTIRVRARAYMDASATPTCSVASNPTIIEDAPGWIQALGSFAIAEAANIRILIPQNTFDFIEPVTNVLDTASAIYGGTLRLGEGNVSNTDRNVNTSISHDISYDVLEGLIPAGTAPRALGSSINGSYINSVSGTSYEGHEYYQRVGNLTISGPTTLTSNNKKAVIFVDGNLTITDDVTYAGSSPKTQFIMMIVSGDLTIHPNVDELHGVYYVDGNIYTGSGSNQLHAYGSVVSGNQIVFQRDLGDDNVDTPAEQFEYDPNIYFNYPRALILPKVLWQEVAPNN